MILKQFKNLSLTVWQFFWIFKFFDGPSVKYMGFLQRRKFLPCFLVHSIWSKFKNRPESRQILIWATFTIKFVAWNQIILTYFVRGSNPVRLTSLDSAALVMFNQHQIYLFGQIQCSQTGGQPYSDTSPYAVSECSLSRIFKNRPIWSHWLVVGVAIQFYCWTTF